MLAIKLDKQISCEQICFIAQQLITKFQQSSPDLSNALLIIDIKNITDGELTKDFPKLEYKN